MKKQVTEMCAAFESQRPLGQHPVGPNSFATTCWSLVADAGTADSPEAQAALATLCQAYWTPLYAFARRRGSSAADAADLTQGFFAILIEKEYLQAAKRERGRFRTFLLTAFQRFLINEHDRATEQKRGGGAVLVSIDIQRQPIRRSPNASIEKQRLLPGWDTRILLPYMISVQCIRLKLLHRPADDSSIS